MPITIPYKKGTSHRVKHTLSLKMRNVLFRNQQLASIWLDSHPRWSLTRSMKPPSITPPIAFIALAILMRWYGYWRPYGYWCPMQMDFVLEGSFGLNTIIECSQFFVYKFKYITIFILVAFTNKWLEFYHHNLNLIVINHSLEYSQQFQPYYYLIVNSINLSRIHF